MTNRERRNFELAEKIAQKVNNGSTFFFGGILAKKGKVISLGYNQPYKSHPRSPSKWRNIHCELSTILGVDRKDIIGSTLFLVRLAYAKTKRAMAKPCSDCENLIRSTGISRVVYSIEDDVVGYWNVKSDEYYKETI